MKRLRMVKVLVQPVAVLDDGENIEELAASPITVPWAMWEQFISGGFDQALEQWRTTAEQEEERS